MRIVADLHVHSKYARGTSPRCDIPGLAEGAKIKGITLIATGDFTHPAYFNEIKQKFDEDESGIFTYKHTNFILSTEVSVIFELAGKTKKMHHILLSPSLEISAQINDCLSKHGNLKADGRPMLSLSSAGLADELFSISRKITIIPAHVWTPWFSIFGSKSGVDSVDEAFQEHSDKIFALETGLSSDPALNWTLSSLDQFTLVSNSDAHSLEKLGREANVFDLEKLDYDSIIEAIKTKKGFVKTYEFYPEEGKYHYDGHRKCNVIMSPQEAINNKLICPVCRRKLTIGVAHRITDLADRKLGFKPETAPPFQYIVPLSIIISKCLKKGENTKAVLEEYAKLIKYFGSEFAVFEANPEQIRLAASPAVADGILKAMQGRVRWIPGYDGVFGKLILDEDPHKNVVDKKQKNLSDF
ncbi:endonuclease Q family protein [Candidatus Micrarchaeota archaeon]|nr:endonuclease Q family protein [Candidatus Micrarchaeota archaeon]